MDFATWVARLGIPLASFVIAFASALIPLVNAEAYLVFAALAFPAGSLTTVVVMVTAGQMSGKVILFLAGRGTLRLPLQRHQDRLEQARATLERYRTASGAVIFLSALSGLPPFYFVSLAAGVLRLSLTGFVLWGSAGRGLRFAACAFAPQLLRSTW